MFGHSPFAAPMLAMNCCSLRRVAEGEGMCLGDVNAWGGGCGGVRWVRYEGVSLDGCARVSVCEFTSECIDVS